MTVRKGYDATTVADILGEAGVGRESFYEIFDDKLDCMLAAHRVLLDDLEARLRTDYQAPGPWPARMRAALSTTLAWFAADPEATRFILVEMSTVGPAFRATFQSEYARFTKLLDDGLADGGPTPAMTQATQLAVGAILARIYEEVVLGRVEELPRLLPDLTYNLLVPYIGEAAAQAEREAAAKAPSE